MSRLRAVHGAVPTSLTEVHECVITDERLVAIAVCNTTSSNIWFSLALDRNGDQTYIYNEVVIYQHDTWAKSPLYFLTRDMQDGPRTVGDKLLVQAESVGLDVHLFIEQMDPD